MTNPNSESFYAVSVRGLKKGWDGFVWMLKILVPISFVTFIIETLGWLSAAEKILGPVMGMLYLPASAALPIAVGLLTGIYGGLAAMAVIPLTTDQMTLIAVFLLICHNLIQEAAIQGKSGLNPVKAAIFRLVAAAVTVIIVAQFLDTDGALSAPASSLAVAGKPFAHAFRAWGGAMVKLCFRILVIIMCLMVFLEWMKPLGMVDRLADILSPLMKGFGLRSNAGPLWIMALLFGISYGAAVIVQEAAEGDLDAEELERLHLSIGIQHAVVEDPAVFLPLGLSAFWLWVPRMIAAIVAVHLLNLYRRIRGQGGCKGTPRPAV